MQVRWYASLKLPMSRRIWYLPTSSASTMEQTISSWAAETFACP